MNKIHLLVPMSGQGTRYRRAGYSQPKPMIPVSGVPMVERLLARFPSDWPAHFVMAENHRATELPDLLRRLRPGASETFIEPHDRGPGHAISAALAKIPDEDPVFVTYCDYDMEWDAARFDAFVRATGCDACLVSYRGFHAHYLNPVTYAYSRLEGDLVAEVREKGSFTPNRESEFASSGGYYFRSAKILREALRYQLDHDLTLNGESYTSLTVEALLRDRKEKGRPANVRVFEIPFFCQWGTPEDLRNFEHWERSYRADSRSGKSRLSVDQVLLPMAGLGTRFRDITPVPKAFIPVAGKAMFRRALDSLPLPEKNLVVVALREHADLVRKHSPKGTVVVELDSTPSGQALSVEAGLEALDSSREVFVSSCDHGITLDESIWTGFRKNPDCDAAIFTVRGYPGTDRKPNAFAYVDISPENSETPRVRGVSVKKPLSEKPSDDPLLVGTFWFRSAKVLADGISELKNRNLRVNGELYLDSVFECLIAGGKTVRMIPLEGYLGWGDPNSLAEALYWHDFFTGRALAERPRYPGVSTNGNPPR